MPRVVTLEDLCEILLGTSKVLSGEINLKGTAHDRFEEGILKPGSKIGHELPGEE